MLLDFLSGLGTRGKEPGDRAEAGRPKEKHMLQVHEKPASGNGLDATPAMDLRSEKKLRWRIHGENGAERMTITPAIAKVMLEWNDRNRPVSSATVKKYAAAIAAGRWAYTGEPIIFSGERLIDGQHRLEAVIQSGQAIEALIVFGAPDDAFAFIDVGKTRTASDIFAINGVKNWTLMAAAIVWVAGYERGTIGAAAKGGAMDHQQLYDEYMLHEGMQESAWVGHSFAQSRLASPSTMVAFHYLCARKSRRAADEFFQRVADGIGFTSKNDPAYKLHRRLMDSVTKEEKRLNRKSVAAITVKAWNAARLGRKAVSLTFTPDEKFPRII